MKKYIFKNLTPKKIKNAMMMFNLIGSVVLSFIMGYLVNDIKKGEN